MTKVKREERPAFEGGRRKRKKENRRGKKKKDKEMVPRGKSFRVFQI